MGILLPRTDLAVLVQLVATLVIGVPLFVVAKRRGGSDLAWFVGGAMLFLLGFFALRTAH